MTDLARFGYLTDIRRRAFASGRGLGRWLTDCMVAHPQLQGFGRLARLTRDAETLYRKAGFEAAAAPLVYLERRSTRAGRHP